MGHSARLAEISPTSVAIMALVCLTGAALAVRAAPLPPPVTGDAAFEGQAKAPLAFVPNRGQGPAGTRYYAQGSGFAFGFGARRATFALEQEGRGHVLGLRFVGANPDAVVEPRRPAQGTVSYFGGNATRGAQALPTYRVITYRGLWPGIDMVFSGAAGQLKYTFVVHPGAQVADIRLAYEAGRLSLTGAGDLLVRTPLGALRDPRPRSYQRVGGRRAPVPSEFSLTGGAAYGVTVGRYDRSRALVIDPGLVYGTFLGGTESDEASALAIDSEGAAYVAGSSSSSDFPTTPGAYDPDARPAVAFVTKLDPTGSELVYSTVIGAGGFGTFAVALGVDVDAEGAAYLTGFTDQDGFPTTPGAFDTSFSSGGPIDGWAAKLSADGSHLEYSTFLGGGGFEKATDIAVDEAGHAHVTGRTDSSNFPLTPGAADATLGLGSDAFVTKFTPDGSALAYSTLLGGTGSENAEGEIGNVAIHGGRAYVTGNTTSADFPTTEGVHDRTRAGCYDVFVTEVNTAGTEFLRSTLVGGASCDYPLGIAVDPEGNPYVAGHTDSTDFPTTTGAFDSSFNGGSGDAYALRLDAGTFQLGYSTYIGGSANDNFELHGDIDVDSRGHAYLTGVTQSPDYPLTPDAAFATSGGIFLTKVAADGTFLDYSTLLGYAAGRGVATDDHGNAYIAGITFSDDVQTTAGAFDTTFNNGSNAFSADAFVQKVDTSRDCTVFAKGRLAGNKRARLDLNASIRSDGPQPRGRIRYHDTDAHLLLRTSTVTSLIAYNGHATLRGTARVRGQDATFRIDLDERSGPSPQHVRIELSGGYVADDELKGRIEIDCG